jgi:hypothetical protein
MTGKRCKKIVSGNRNWEECFTVEDTESTEKGNGGRMGQKNGWLCGEDGLT